jgi:hypothetical protein
MGTVDDIRQIFQDFLAPELRAMSTRLDAQNQVMEARFETLNVKLDRLASYIAQVKEMIGVDRRLAKLESRQEQVA